MPHQPSSFDRLRELEQRRNMRQNIAYTPRRDYQRRYPANTLGPNEDILEHRRRIHRKHVTITGVAPENRNVLLVNLGLLIFFAVTIWALYSAIIHLLSHS